MSFERIEPLTEAQVQEFVHLFANENVTKVELTARVKRHACETLDEHTSVSRSTEMELNSNSLPHALEVFRRFQADYTLQKIRFYVDDSSNIRTLYSFTLHVAWRSVKCGLEIPDAIMSNVKTLCNKFWIQDVKLGYG